jgi:hypothetical protein
MGRVLDSRRLGDQDSPAIRQWLASQIVYTRFDLDAIFGQERPKAPVKALLTADTYDQSRMTVNRIETITDRLAFTWQELGVNL